MPSHVLKIRCRIEEVPAIGSFLIESLTESLPDFTAFSPDFDTVYITNATAMLTAVEALVNPKQFTAEMKLITARMKENRNGLRQKINFLEGYIQRATGLTIAPRGFGISPVRKAIHRGDVEGLIAALRYLLQNAANNMAALIAKGYTTAQHDAIAAVRDSLSNDNIAQNASINARNSHVAANYSVITNFWKICTDISAAGKTIYKTTAPDKAKDFTISALRSRVRQQQHKNAFAGAVSSGGIPVNKAKLVLSPLPRGKKRTATTRASGRFRIPGPAAGDYQLTIIVAAAVVKKTTVKIEPGKNLLMDFEL